MDFSDEWDEHNSNQRDRSLHEDTSLVEIRPSISHLLIWTTCSALFLAITKSLSELSSSGLATMQGQNLFYAVLNGAVITGALLLLVERIKRGAPLNRQPGHWLLTVPTVWTLVYLPVIALTAWLEERDPHVLGFADQEKMWVYAVVFAITPVLYAVAAIRSKSLAWRVLFSLLSLASASTSLLFLSIASLPFGGFGYSYITVFSAVSQYGTVILSLLMLIVAGIQHWRGTRGDWLHWMGVVVCALMGIFSLVRVLLQSR